MWGHMLAAVAEEMGASLERTAHSPNIKERLDHSCAVFDHNGRLLAQAAHIPVHLGAMPLMMQTLMPLLDWTPGTMWLCNAPSFGGTHLPDITLVAPVHGSFQHIGFVASRAHHADIGGLSPGSLPLSTSLFQEGLIISPIRLIRDGCLENDVLDLICSNSRTPHERKGDLLAQIAANETGIRRLTSLADRYGVDGLENAADSTIAYSERMVRQTIKELPAGDYFSADFLEPGESSHGVSDDGAKICVMVSVKSDGTILFDFTGSSAQMHGSLNATEAITRSACFYAVRCLVNDDIPTNEGCFGPVTVFAPKGSVVNAANGAAVAGGNVETSQRIVDTVLRALAVAAPDRVPADSQGTMNNVTIGGWDPIRNRSFAYYETIGGGSGATKSRNGFSGIQCHMTNTRNTPVESLESHYPLQIEEYSIRVDCAPNGSRNGGAGIVRRIKMLAPCEVSVLSERRQIAPHGLNGGNGGQCGQNIWICEKGTIEPMPARFTRLAIAGDVLEIRTPGGGGYGELASSPAE